MTENKIKVIKKSVTGKDEKGRSLMIVEDKSIKTPNRFNVAVAPYDFHVSLFGNTYKTKEVNYVKSHMEGIEDARKMYEKLLKESK